MSQCKPACTLEEKMTLKMTRDHNLSFLSEHAHAQLSCTNICTYHMEGLTGKLLYIYRSCFILGIEPSGWKGSVLYGLGADISLPPCLATGIWNLVPKATSGPKSRGASLGTKLWRHVQRYCAQFIAFMVIYGNLCSGYFVYAAGSIQELVMVIEVIGILFTQREVSKN